MYVVNHPTRGYFIGYDKGVPAYTDNKAEAPRMTLDRTLNLPSSVGMPEMDKFLCESCNWALGDCICLKQHISPMETADFPKTEVCKGYTKRLDNYDPFSKGCNC
jgi:hypothetical protein